MEVQNSLRRLPGRDPGFRKSEGLWGHNVYTQNPVVITDTSDG